MIGSAIRSCSLLSLSPSMNATASLMLRRLSSAMLSIVPSLRGRPITVSEWALAMSARCELSICTWRASMRRRSAWHSWQGFCDMKPLSHSLTDTFSVESHHWVMLGMTPSKCLLPWARSRVLPRAGAPSAP